jgi:signal transduction histidine kinase
MDARRQSSTSGALSQAEQNQHELQTRLQLLIDAGLALSGERELEKIMQTALDVALSISCAQFGVFYYIAADTDGGPLQLHKLSAKDPKLLLELAHPSLDATFGGRSLDKEVFRSADISEDSRFQNSPFKDRNPFAGTPFCGLTLRSFLSVPVRTRAGDLLGGILLGHPNADEFTAECESHVLTIAAQAAAAMENAQLAKTLTQEIALADSARRLQRETADRLASAFENAADTTRRLRQALDAAQLGTWTWDRETDMLDLDERANALLDGDGAHVPVLRAELRKRIVHDEDLDQTAENLHEILLAGSSYNAEYRVETRDGRQHWVSSRAIATFAPNAADRASFSLETESGEGLPREIIGMIGTVQDITVRKTQEATLRQSEKLAATGRLAATIAHEINNPLEAVTNLIYLSKTDPSVPPAIAHLLDTADNELARVAQIAQQTLGFYRDTTRPIDIDLTALLEGVANLFSRKMDYKRIKCELDIEPDLHIYGLQGEVRQVFSNLLVNAIDASSKSLIHIRARHTTCTGRPGISVIISDQGSGIPVAIRQRLFSPFFTTKQSVGTGLGLWVTRGIIEKQGGSIRFRSRTDKPSGTVFRVFLPAESPGLEKFNASRSNLIQ